jgi:hypothetical protein
MFCRQNHIGPRPKRQQFGDGHSVRCSFPCVVCLVHQVGQFCPAILPGEETAFFYRAAPNLILGLNISQWDVQLPLVR